jgi:uncharacterized protein (TIGR02996 family)
MSEEREPEALLDAIADEPEASGPWRVLADWLLDRGAPHALLAAYELRLEEGPAEPALLEAIDEARLARRQPPPGLGLNFEDATWRCGYITRLAVPLGLQHRDSDWAAFFDASQLRLLQWLQLTVVKGHEDGAVLRALRQLRRALPRTLRRISVFSHDPRAVTLEHLSPLLDRPRGVTRLDLALGLAGRQTVDAVAALCDADYSLVNLDGTSLSPEGAAELVQRAGRTLRLAGTGLTRAAAQALDGPRVAWCAPDVRVAVVRDTGVLVPLSDNGTQALHYPSWPRREFARTASGWRVVYPAPAGGEPLSVDLVEDGQWVMLRGGLVRVLMRQPLDVTYRELLALEREE